MGLQLKFLVKNSNDPAVAVLALQYVRTEGVSSACLRYAVGSLRDELRAHLALIQIQSPHFTKRLMKVQPPPKVGEPVRDESPIIALITQIEQKRDAPPKRLDLPPLQLDFQTKYGAILRKQRDKLQDLQQDFMKQQMQTMMKHYQQHQLDTLLTWREVMKLEDATLHARVTDADPLVRLFALQAAGKKRLPIEKEAITLLTDPFPQVRQAARQTLSRLGRGVDFGPEPTATAPQIAQAVRQWNQWHTVQQQAEADEPPPNGSSKK